MKDDKVIITIYSQKLLQGRPLDVITPDQLLEGSVVEIFVNRDNIVESGASELWSLVADNLGDMSNPLDVTFNGEDAKDYGGPRREFIALCLQVIRE